ncbi:PREDICTED: cilia- and flagella-associated protein 100 [Nanorana parkeri]|uniref:cilia- and flagella-associated protein 100 n=1 Tax=Nanorana parkeri TaxID=125878 RepID=UPI000854AFA8|nr:PREDICTED: cilia- and flagella-associated protein 100 [Nanorana parkeri]
MSSLTLERSFVSRESTASGSRGARTTSQRSAQRSIVSSAKSGPDTKSILSAQAKKKKNEANPFKISPDADFFLLRDQEREKQEKEKEMKQNLKVHQKGTYSTKMNAKMARLRKEIEAEEMEEAAEDEEKAMAVLDNASWKLEVTKDRQVPRESLHEFIDKKKEMFLLQYSLTVKRDEIQKLEAMAAAEELKLEKAEQFLEEDAVRFDEFLKQNDRNSVEALKQADKETKLKMEQVAQIKSHTAQMMNIKSDISKCEETLREYLMYKEFLFRLSPKEWKEEVLKKKAGKMKSPPLTFKEKEKQVPETKVSPSPIPGKKAESRSSGQISQSRDSTRDLQNPSSRQSLKTAGSNKLSSATNQTEDKSVSESLVSSDSEEEPELYFTDPQQLLDIFSELEEQNLSLIQNSQETEEALEEIKHTAATTEKKMQRETQQLKDLIAHLKASIAQEEERATDLELKSRVFTFGQNKPEDQDKMLSSLSSKVEDVYRACIGENRANLSALQMLMVIEHQLEELLDNIEVIPKDQTLREEKIKQQKLHQEDRLRRALERAQADPKKTTGRKLMTRSDPPTLKLRTDKDQDKIDKEKEETMLFFT